MPSVLSSAQSGLAAAQLGLSVTGHNISNVNTPGFTRQRLVQASGLAQNTGSGYVGSGTNVQGIARVYDQYMETRVINAQASSAALNSYYAQIQQVDSLLSDTASGLTPNLQAFFNGIQTLTSDPNSSASRQAMLSSATQLVSSFNSLDNQLSEIQTGLNGQIRTSVDTINSYANQIANLNKAIEETTNGQSNVQAPNDLLDQRDQLVSDMGKEIKVTVIAQSNSYNLFIGSGQPLVVGPSVFSLAATPSTTDHGRLEVAYVVPSAVIPLSETMLTGGKLGGLFDFRNNTLDVTQNELGRIATGISMTFNAQHALGQDQHGALGGDFFTVAAPLVTLASTNTGDGALSCTLSDASALTNSNYQLSFDGTNYNVTRIQDATVLYSGGVPPTGPLDGINFTLTGTMQAGDHMLIKPTALGAASMAVLITDRSKIAAAAPIRTSTTANNKGSGTISAGVVIGPPPTNANLRNPVTIQFTSATTYDVIDTGTGTPLATAQAYVAGQDIPADPSITGVPKPFDNGWSVQISGTPAANDSFTIGPNTNGVGDNRNALLLGALQATKTLDNGTASYNGAFAQLVSAVGNKAHELSVTSKAETNMFEQVTAAQQAQGGVNLDEEATNLMKYQQAYAASAKVMAAAQKMFDILAALGA